MEELQRILTAFAQFKQSGQRAAIATVVKTSGSVYRRPGARLLLTEQGQMIGAVSGGCLESDVLERSQSLLLETGSPIVVTYDTTASEDLIWGLGLGCNGVVQVLIESIQTSSAGHSLELIAACFRQQEMGVIATIFHVEGAINVPLASRVILNPDGTVWHDIPDHLLLAKLLQAADQSRSEKRTQVVVYPLENGVVEALIEVIQPPVPLLICGAGTDVVPLVQFAKQLGWHVTVIAPRSTAATLDRFPQTDQFIACKPEDLSAQITLTANTIVVIMTHHYLQDQRLLRVLLPLSLRYLGILGPKQRTQQLLENLRGEGIVINPSHSLHSPIGLDIGAETAAEIALAIVAEIQAVLADRSGGFLRDRRGSIHSESPPCLTLV
jgi:xanthine/CO dehydrogenase XdhC/CoxF family maturation factor